MARRVVLGGRVFLALTIFLAPAFSAVTGLQPKPKVDLKQHPTGGKTPIEVWVGLYITNFVAIDETRETFEFGGYLTAKWRDSRLVLSPDEADAKRTRQFRMEDLWVPSIESANSISHKTGQYFLTAAPDGVVTYVERFDATLSNNYNFRKFPFDTQVLRFEFHPFLSSDREIRFAPQALSSSGISEDENTQLAAWKIKDLQYTMDKIGGNLHLPSADEALFRIVVVRRSGFYLWKIFLPLLMITLIPAVVFWIDVEMFDWVLKIPMTMLLSMVAFEFTISRDLPRIGYITFLDAVFLASFIFLFLCIFEILVVFLMQKRGQRERAVKIHRSGRWIYPSAYAGVILLLAVVFLA